MNTRFKLIWAVLLAGWMMGGALIAKVADSPELARPLAVGAKAPTTTLPCVDGTSVDLAKVFAEKPTILIFYRGGWCPYCNRHLAALGETELELRKLGYQIVAISPDAVEKLAETADVHHLRYRLLSDRRLQVSGDYGVAYKISQADGAAYKENGISLAGIPGTPDFWLPVPTAFIVDRHGDIKFVFSDADPSVRISTSDLLAAAKAVAAAGTSAAAGTN